MRELTAEQARAVRLRSLRLVADRQAPPAPVPADAVVELVTWLGALQGQDMHSLLWSLGVRLPGSTVTGLRAALEQGGVLRTWPMRGTLHLVPSRDARWMLQLMAPRTSRAEITRRSQLGLTEADTDRAVDLLGGALAGGVRLTRAECLDRLAAAGITVAGQAGYHLLGAACRRGVACLAPDVGREQTFVLLDDWAPQQCALDREEALAEIAVRFVRSHGPVGRRDLAGWTGLTLTDVDRGLAAMGPALAPVVVDGLELVAWAPSLDRDDAVDRDDAADSGGCLVLPGFDEFVLGYKDRSLQLDAAHWPAIVPGGNGVFRPTLVRAGRVMGTWRRTAGRRAAVVEALPFEPLAADDRRAFERALARYGAYLELDAVEVRWPAG